MADMYYPSILELLEAKRHYAKLLPSARKRVILQELGCPPSLLWRLANHELDAALAGDIATLSLARTRPLDVFIPRGGADGLARNQFIYVRYARKLALCDYFRRTRRLTLLRHRQHRRAYRKTWGKLPNVGPHYVTSRDASEEI